MPTITVNGVRLHYEETGAGPETIVFAHGLLWSGWMFGPQVAALKSRYRCITYDHRGQGQSEVAATGYDMDTLTEDAAALIRALGAAPCHFAGLSMGGFVAMRLGARHPELIRSLMLLETSADAEPPENQRGHRLMAFIARWLSVRLVQNQVMEIMFGPKFLTDWTRTALREECRRRLIANNRVGSNRAIFGVLDRAAVDEEIRKIAAPTLILVGDEDRATPPVKSQRISDRIANSKLVLIADAGHTSSVEEPEAITRAITEFLAGLAR